ncbi:MFS transporter [Pararhodonellum marinum]|uniref:MFS transporter n=1 Tax=Pararhodonellum marinum TaxID=2755358 RepID=UPI00188F1141|nr:MFS transporter [Pararhodonellum marinum]
MHIDKSHVPVSVFFLLAAPHGLSSGFVSVTLPYVLVQHGFSVATAASITAIGLSALMWNFLWAPIIDLSFSLHRWYLIGVAFCALSLISVGFIPLDVEMTGVFMGVVFISQVAGSISVIPVGGFMAKTVPVSKKGKAGGWYEAGYLGGLGAGGGAGIWLTEHVNYMTSLMVIAAAILFCAMGLIFLPSIKATQGTLSDRLKLVKKDISSLFHSKIALVSLAIILTPIGIGAGSYLWSSVASNWQVDADTIALVTGVLSALVSVLGCLFGGWFADKKDQWWAFFGAGGLMALVTLVMAFSPSVPFVYVSGVLVYAFATGMAYAGFLAIALHAVGKGLASTKMAIFISLGNFAPVYMTALDGWVHDTFGIRHMLLFETLLGAFFIFSCILLLVKLRVPSKRQMEMVSE